VTLARHIAPASKSVTATNTDAATSRTVTTVDVPRVIMSGSLK